MADYSEMKPEPYLLLPNTKERFWSKVLISKPDECWIWQGAVGNHGYGVFSYQRRLVRAHRTAYLYTHGHLPNIARHTCDVRSCCNPAHLLNGNRLDNARDAVARNRVSRGARHITNAKLTATEVREIRNDKSCSQSELGRRYSVSRSTIDRIKRGKIWKAEDSHA